jgi:hypothetical protein
MKFIYNSIFNLAIVLLLFSSCKKNPPSINNPVGGNSTAVVKVDHQYLQGWWYPDGGYGYMMYFGPDNFCTLTYLDPILANKAFSWAWSPTNDSLYLGATIAAYHVSKLTKDSLIFLSQLCHKMPWPMMIANPISTIAGNGTDGQNTLNGNGGLALNAALSFPTDVALDAIGNVYFCDSFTHSVRKITVTNGLITTIAGTGKQGLSGDGGAAVNAKLYSPKGIAIDPAGNIYISDTYNNRLRKISASTGTITTIAGNGGSSSYGDGGPAISANISYPTKLVFDKAGNLYFAENYRVRKIDAINSIITTVAGSTYNGYSTTNQGIGGLATNAIISPAGIALDASNNLFILSYSNILKVDMNSGIISSIAGTGVNGFNGDGGPANTTQLLGGSKLVFDANGNLIFQDGGRIREILASDGTVRTIAGSGFAGFNGDGSHAAGYGLSNPQGFAIDAAKNIYIADAGNNRIRKVAGY